MNVASPVRCTASPPPEIAGLRSAAAVRERCSMVARWVAGADFNPDKFEQEVDALCVEDRDGNPIALFKSEWNLNYATGRHPSWTWSAVAPVVPLSKRK